MTLDSAVVAAFVLVLARTSAWVVTAPIMAGKAIPSLAKLAVAISLSLFVVPQVHPASVPSEPILFAGVAVGQVLIGLALGWVTGLFFNAFEMAGSMIDAASGFSIGAIFDPITGSQASIYARFNQMLFMALLFVTNAHLTLVAGFLRSFKALPADKFPVLGISTPGALGTAVSQLMVSALEIGAPILGALFLTEVALAIAARFAPQANIFSLGLPLKVMVSVLAMGTALVLIPPHLPGLLDSGMSLANDLFKH
ncbi:MAG TPA: flagellar biosynthetic protein FliR [Acidimicrobiales bacterium]|nr:flagellar biosynthetic protein FliR [Acidimicrobiales bacterium]